MLKLLSLVENWICECVFPNATKEDQWIEDLKETLYQPERIREREDAAERIKPAVKGQEGGLVLKKRKPAAAPSESDLAAILGRTPAPTPNQPIIGLNDDGELDLSS